MTCTTGSNECSGRPVLERVSAYVGKSCQAETEGNSPFYCTDHDSVQGVRLDYVFVENEAESHAISLDVKSIRRVPRWRNSEVGADKSTTDYWRDDEEETPNYLSDHMGLEVYFAVAER